MNLAAVESINPTALGVFFSVVIGIGVYLLLETGRRIGARRLAAEGEAATKGVGPIEGAVFGLLGLILAFSFSGALSRFDDRRRLVVEESNDIGTAWLRIDLLPSDSQPAMRDLFRRYLDSRILTYKKLPDVTAAKEEFQQSVRMQNEIWALAVAASQKSQNTQAGMLLLPALNEMIDITSTRAEAVRLHPPTIIFVMLGTLTLACALFAGYDMAGRKGLNLLHSIAFTAVLVVTIYVIIDLEYPRLGLIQMTDSDQVLDELRKSMGN